MRIKLLSVLVAALLAVLPASSFAAGWQVGLQGGATVPTGDFADIDAQTGFLLGGLVDYMYNDMWAFGGDASFSRNNHKDVGTTVDLGGGSTYTLDEDKYTVMQFGVHTKYLFPASGVLKPFGIAGVGMSSFKEEYTETFASPGSPNNTQSYENKTESRFGGKLGVGAIWWMNEMWGFGGEGDYNYVSEDGGSLTYFGLRANLMFKIPTAK